MATRASDRAYDLLREEILEWQLEPGTTLGEVEQAARLGISRTPLREALARLAADGLVANESGRGLVVTTVSTKDAAELFELRQALEQQAARLAARRRDEPTFRALLADFDHVDALLAADDPSRHDYYELVRRFDRAVDEAVDSAYLVSALGNLRTHLARLRRLSQDNPARLFEAASEHRMIVQAIVDGDPDLAAHATHVHLHRSLSTILAAAAAAETAAAANPAPATTPTKRTPDGRISRRTHPPQR